MTPPAIAVPTLDMLPPDRLGTVVTYLEMRQRPAPPEPVRSALKLVRWDTVDRERYLDLFRRVGSPWLWCGRLLIPLAELDKVLADPHTEIYAATRRDGSAVGMLELDFSVPGETEIYYFGLTADMTGRGHGGWLMAHALRLAWRPDTTRVWLHTCTHDHPAALRFYQRQGFKVYARALESIPDPRVLGLLPRDAGPHIPLLA
jgi:ribosomal protein S18 acetylase RimI-like enzyme